MTEAMEKLKRDLEAGKTVKVANVNLELLRVFRKVLTMIERGELVSGVFVGLQPNGLTLEATAVADGPARAIVATSLRCAAQKQEIAWDLLNSTPMDASPIIKAAG